jgi:hypothetical protein
MRDRDRLVVLHQVHDGVLCCAEGARRVRLGVRHFRRLLRRFEVEGDAAVIHRGRDRPSNRRLPAAVRAAALERAREPAFHDFGPTLLAEHLSRDPTIGQLSADTLRAWMIAAFAPLLRPGPAAGRATGGAMPQPASIRLASGDSDRAQSPAELTR